MDSTDELTRLAEAERQLKEQHAAKKKELAALYKKERGVIQKKVSIARKPHQCSRTQAQDAAAHFDGLLHGTHHR